MKNLFLSLRVSFLAWKNNWFTNNPLTFVWLFDSVILFGEGTTTTEFWPLLWLFASNCLSDQLICMSFLCANSILEFDEKFFLLLWKIFWCHWSIDFPALRSEQICNLNISANGNLLEVFQGEKVINYSLLCPPQMSQNWRWTNDFPFVISDYPLSDLTPSSSE